MSATDNDAPGPPVRRDIWAFPREYTAGGIDWFQRAANELGRASNDLYRQIRTETVADLPRAKSVPRASEDPVPEADTFRMLDYQYEFVIKADEALTFDVGAYLATIDGYGTARANSVAEGMIQHIADVAEARGQTVNAAGMHPYDAIIAAAKLAEIAFDDEGNPQTTIVTSPAMKQSLIDNPPSPEQVERYNAVIERKKEEWNAARRRRDLP